MARRTWRWRDLTSAQRNETTESTMVMRPAPEIGTDGAVLPVPIPDTAGQPAVIPVRRGGSGRTVGVVLVDDRDGPRWQPTPDVEGLVRLGIVAAAAVALPVGVAWGLRRPVARVDRLSMGPGGWVSFKGFAVPKGRPEQRPWWARLLRAHRVS